MSTIGLDLLGLGHKLWPIKTTIKVFPSGWALGCFDTTFGNAIPNVKALLATGKVSLLRVHIWWSDNHVIAPLSALRNRIPLYEAIARANPGVKVYISHSCEYNSKSVTEVKTRVDLIKKLAPSCIPVNTPMGGSVSLPGVVTEVHGDPKALKTPYIVSTDGEPIYDMDAGGYVRRHGASIATFLWGVRFNLAEAGAPGTPRIPPLQRTAVPDERYLRAIIRLGSPEGTAPAPEFKGKVIPFKKPYLYKSFAEDKKGEDPRANKPLTITPDKSPAMAVVAKNGDQVAMFKYFGAYPPNLQRHYSGSGSNLYGYEIGSRAEKISGSEFVWFKSPQKVYYGPVNPSFRRGFFQT